MIQSLFYTIVFGALGISTLCAQLPVTQAYAFRMKQVTDSIYLFDQPRYLSGINEKGYNNQPCFLDENTYFLTVSFPGTKTNIYRFDLRGNKLSQVTATTGQGEYSAMKIPGTRDFAMIHVDSTDESQYLVKAPLDQSTEASVVFPEIKNAGYHTWLNDTLCALFLVGKPHELHIGKTKSQQTERIARDIGRCLKSNSEGELYYVQSLRDGKKYIYRYDPWLQEKEFVIRCLDGMEDFELLPDGRLLMASGSALYVYHPVLYDEWKKIADFDDHGLTNITRLASNGKDQLILINVRSHP